MRGVLETARAIISERCLCDNCLGRQFANLGHGMDNAERGKALKTVLIFEAHNLAIKESKEGITILRKLAANSNSDAARSILEKIGLPLTRQEPKRCEICKNKFQGIHTLAEAALDRIKDYDFDSFIVGAKIPVEIVEAEDTFRAKYGIRWGETVKSEFTREIGKAISKITSKKSDHKNPNIVFLIHPFTDEISFEANPIFIEGRYKKIITGIPQSKWWCTECYGNGCEKCGGTGKEYPESVHEIIEMPILKECLGDSSGFHGGGREDVDVKVLGEGRPFVIEVKNPKRRHFDLQTVQNAINKSRKVEVLNLSFAGKESVRRVKTSEAAYKTYQLEAESEEDFTDEDIAKIRETFDGAKIQQRTPRRVLHRRPDKLRLKHIYRMGVEKLAAKKIQLTIQCQGGLYVKEMINGDDGRTIPNVADTIQKKVKSVRLSVLNVGVGINETV